MLKKYFLGLFCIFFLLYFANAATVIDYLPYEINVSGNYTINQDLYSSSSGLTISTTYVNITCNGNTLYGPGSGWGNDGIIINQGYLNVSSCNLVDFSSGIYHSNGNYKYFENMIINVSGGWFSGSNGRPGSSTYRNIKFSNYFAMGDDHMSNVQFHNVSDFDGDYIIYSKNQPVYIDGWTNISSIYLDNADGSVIKNLNYTSKNGGGYFLYMDEGTDNSIVDNISVYDYKIGIFLQSGRNNVLTNLTAMYHSDAGIAAEFNSWEKNIFKNVISMHNYNGLYLRSGHYFENVTLINNSYGVYFYGGSNNEITNFTIKDSNRAFSFNYGSKNNMIHGGVIKNVTWTTIYLNGNNYPSNMPTGNTFYNNSFELGSNFIYMNEIHPDFINFNYTLPNGETIGNYWNTLTDCYETKNVSGSYVCVSNPTITISEEYGMYDYAPLWTEYLPGVILYESFCDCNQLQNIDNNLSSFYRLESNVDCSDSRNWNGGLGFSPIGNKNSPFNGNLDGNSQTISGLYINRPSQNYTGLFSYISGGDGVFDLNVEFDYIDGLDFVGGLAGIINQTNISSVSVVINSNLNASTYVGGMAAQLNNVSKVIGSKISINGNLLSNGYAGGLTAHFHQSGNIENSNVKIIGILDGADYAGGLVGYFDLSGDIISSYTILEKDIIANGYGYAGGLVASFSESGNIFNSYSNVNGNFYAQDNVGGLVGDFYASDNISNSYSIVNGDINSAYYAGGLIGGIYSPNTFLSNSHSILNGNLFSDGDAGGLIGDVYDIQDISSSFSNINGNITSNSSSGGFIGGIYSVNTNITNSHSEVLGNIVGDDDTGGFIGDVYDIQSISSSFSLTGGDINTTYASGGFIGGIYSVNTNITDSYSRVNGSVITSSTIYPAGGFIGDIYDIDDITQSYSYVGSHILSDYYAGGFIGGIYSTNTDIINSSSNVLGSIIGDDNSGGFLGDVFDIGNIISSYSIIAGDIYSLGSSSGGFIGSIDSTNTVIESSYVNVTGNLNGSDPSGGFIGNIYGLDSLFKSYAEVGGDINSSSSVGGFIGNLIMINNLSDTYSNVNGSIFGGSYTGGFVGNYINDTSVKNSYTYVVGNITGNIVGGFSGFYNGSDLIDSFSITGGILTGSGNTGGFAGILSNAVTNSYWNNNSLINLPSIGSGPTSDITAIDNNIDYFKGNVNSPMNNWNTSIWNFNSNAFPSLNIIS